MSNVFVVKEQRSVVRQRLKRNRRNAMTRMLAQFDSLRASIDANLANCDEQQQYEELSNTMLQMQDKLTQLRTALVDVSINGLRERARKLFHLERATGRSGDDWRASLIYCDPPWSYKNANHASGTRTQYPTMSDEAIAAMPVGGLASEDCALLLWATMPRLPAALRVMEAWGFEYCTVFTVWIKTERYGGKPIKRSGDYTQPNAEIVLIGKRGKVSTELTKQKPFKYTNVLMALTRKHSKKPRVMETIAVELFGDVPRIQLFSRDTAPDWISWGNDVDSKHKVSTQIESAKYAGQEKKRKYDLERGADVNAIARRALNRKTSAFNSKNLPHALCTVLDRHEIATSLKKTDAFFKTPDPDEDDAEEDWEHADKRQRFLSVLDSERRGADTDNRRPASEYVSARELRTIGTLQQAFGRARYPRNMTYPLLTQREVEEARGEILQRQMHNADVLFAYSHNKERLPVVYE